MSALKTLTFCCLLATLAGCDQLGIETPDKVAARTEAEGKAVGGACRHAGRALEDCYAMNRRSAKAAVYAGWREMDAYMRENSIAVVKPTEDEAAAPDASAKAETKPGGEKPTSAAEAPKGNEAKPSNEAKPADKTAKPATKTS